MKYLNIRQQHLNAKVSHNRNDFEHIQRRLLMVLDLYMYFAVKTYDNSDIKVKVKVAT